MQLGRVYGLLEPGVIAGHWRKRDADAAANLIENRYKLSRVRDILLRGDEVPRGGSRTSPRSSA